MLKDCPLFDSKVSSKRLINLYYTALMTYLVFTFADDLLQGLVSDFRTEYVLYAIFWLALVIQTTFAYRHIMAIEEENYTVNVLISDCIDVIIEVFVCAIIGSTNMANGYHELPDYRLLSVPFMILAINQIYWYHGVQESNPRAIFRLIILFVGMLTITILESINHSIYNLAIFVIIHALAMAILRAFDEKRGSGISSQKRQSRAEDKNLTTTPIDKK